MRGLLRHRDASLYISGQVVSLIGDTTLWLGLAIWVKQITGSASAAGLVFFVCSLGYLTGPLSGLVVDRVRRRPLMLLVNLASAATVLLILLVQGPAQLWLVYVVIGLYGASGALLGSAQSALLTVVLPEDLLAPANAAIQTGREACRLIAPLGGAGLVALTGTAKPVAVIDAASFVIAAVTLQLLHVREARPTQRENRWMTEISAGLRHVWRTPALRQIVTATAVAMLVVGFTETVIFVVVQVGLHEPATFVGVLMAFQGSGAVAGAVTAPWIIRKLGEGRTLAVGLSVFAVGDALLMVGAVPVAAVAIAIAGAGLPWAIVAFATSIQRRTPATLQGRTFAAADAVATLTQTLSIGVGAGLVLIADYRVLLGAMAAVVLVSAAWLATRTEQRVLLPSVSSRAPETETSAAE
ncbi:MAG: MFS transporter [Candidatus Dormibacteraeota bacterium]|uniref:MFS transporter n=1 Tax=Candidatus Aeolococcus gillhamiae TaxID=3127015 RepID=A0A934NAK5_9BACT|nr:MFS transporter [Candidatus Dormibacteraeota bacterium]